jgi:hypothetical protein
MLRKVKIVSDEAKGRSVKVIDQESGEEITRISALSIEVHPGHGPILARITILAEAQLDMAALPVIEPCPVRGGVGR